MSFPLSGSRVSSPSLPRAARLAALAAAVAALCLAAGCGGGGGDAGTGDTSTTSTGGTSNSGSTSSGGTTSGGGDATGGSGSTTAGGGDAGTTGGTTGTGTTTGTTTGTDTDTSTTTTVADDATDPDAIATLQNTGARDTIASVGAAASGARLYMVGGTVTPTGAIHVASMMAVPWATLPAGSSVLVAAGSYSGVSTITATGTRALPITITAADPAHPPIFGNSFDFQRSSYVQVSHVYVQSPTYAAFIVRNASNHITVSDSTISRAPVGISVTDGAGTGHQFLRNVISASVTHGISVDVNADPAERTLIQRNTVLSSGQHGMEIRASHYQVEYNTVGYSGYAGGGGISGIHVYRGTQTEDSGADNLVRYNLAYNSIDRVAVDGNGIEVDQWCNGNTVAYNQVWGNDGAGIIVFDGSTNLVQNNTAWDDNVDTGHTHVSKGEIIVSGTLAANVRGNHVWNNIAYSTRPAVPALYVDTRAVSGGNTIGANLYWNSGTSGQIVRWTDSTIQQTAAAVDALTGVGGSVVAAPLFSNTAAKLTGGLRLSQPTPQPGLMPAGQSDYAGVAAKAGQTYLGAYFAGS